MKNISPWLALALALCLGTAPAWAGEAVAGVIVAVHGKPAFKPGAQGNAKPVKLNQFINEGDQLITKAGERVAIAFIGGAEVRIDENSIFIVDTGGGQKPTQLSTVIGKAWTRLLHGKAGLNIRTPNSVAAVRGTEADVESAERTTVKVYEGYVDVFNDHGKQSLTAGQMTQVASAQAAPEPPKTMKPEDVGTWQDGLKTEGAEKQLGRLQKEADRRRNLEFKTKSGKKIRLELEKK